MRLFVINHLGAFLLRVLGNDHATSDPRSADVIWRDTRGRWWFCGETDSVKAMAKELTHWSRKPSNVSWTRFQPSNQNMNDWMIDWDMRHPFPCEYPLGYRTGPRFGPDVHTVNHVGIYDRKNHWICNVTGRAQAKDLLAILSRIKEN